MVFSDTTNKSGLIQDVEFLTGLGDAEISGDATLLAITTKNINAWYHKVVTMVLQSQDDWDFDDINHSDYPVLTEDMVADQRDYPIPASEKVLKIKRLDVTYDGTNYYKAERFDINESGLGFGNDTTVDGRFSKAEPYYDLVANAIWLYPRASAANVTAGAKLRITWSREIDEFTTADTTQEPGIDEPFHRMLSIGAALDYAMVHQKPNKNDLAIMLQDYEARLRGHYGSKNKDKDVVLKSAYVNYE